MMSHIPLRARAERSPRTMLQWALLAVTTVSALSAIGGGVGLLVSGLGIPTSFLDDTPFSSFTIPALILGVVVGGSMATAAIAIWQRVAWAGEVAIVAGIVMLGWITIEAMMIPDGRGLQWAVAGLSVMTIALGYAVRRAGNA